MKKILALLILAAMTCAMFAVPSFAATPKEYQAAYGTPVIDGKMDDAYLQSTKILIEYSYDEANQEWYDAGKLDCAHGYAYLLWDDAYLYAYVYVIDDVLSEAKSPTGVFLTDSTEIIIDLDNTQDGALTEEMDAGQFTAGYLETDMAGYGYLFTMYGEECSFMVRDTAEGYAIEYKIPFGPDYSPAKAGWTIGIAIAINDDADGKEGREYIAYTNADQLGCWYRCSNYDQLTLIEGEGSHSGNNPSNTTKPQQGNDEPDETTNNSGTTNPSDTTGSPDETKAPSGDVTTAGKNPSSTKAPSSSEEKEGCGSAVGGTALVLLGVCALPVIVSKKKQH